MQHPKNLTNKLTIQTQVSMDCFCSSGYISNRMPSVKYLSTTENLQGLEHKATYIKDRLNNPSGYANSVYTAICIFMNTNVRLSTLSSNTHSTGSYTHHDSMLCDNNVTLQFDKSFPSNINEIRHLMYRTELTVQEEVNV